MDIFQTTPDGFQFLDPGSLVDGDLSLVVTEQYPGDPAIHHVPAYYFQMTHVVTGENMGHLHLRVGDNMQIYYCGHIGYGVFEKFRGRRLAARACRLVFPLARAHDIRTLWITCNPDNVPSRRTCRGLGGTLVEIIPVPEESDMYRAGDRHKCRYWFELAEPRVS